MKRKRNSTEQRELECQEREIAKLDGWSKAREAEEEQEERKAGEGEGDGAEESQVRTNELARVEDGGEFFLKHTMCFLNLTNQEADIDIVLTILEEDVQHDKEFSKLKRTLVVFAEQGIWMKEREEKRLKEIEELRVEKEKLRDRLEELKTVEEKWKARVEPV
ncbi:hypothetical protein BGX38DRAFT_1274304 [Terfezia claveryi]|nr:hypothetical protein BGX38DRAFT_1274304 [Terfezia claveryi]